MYCCLFGLAWSVCVLFRVYWCPSNAFDSQHSRYARLVKHLICPSSPCILLTSEGQTRLAFVWFLGLFSPLEEQKLPAEDISSVFNNEDHIVLKHPVPSFSVRQSLSTALAYLFVSYSPWEMMGLP